jgi:hypothetical protein
MILTPLWLDITFSIARIKRRMVKKHQRATIEQNKLPFHRIHLVCESV